MATFCILIVSADEWTTPRQRSCAFVNTPLPCINKAIHHIQELEVKIGRYFQQVHLWLKMAECFLYQVYFKIRLLWWFSLLYSKQCFFFFPREYLTIPWLHFFFSLIESHEFENVMVLFLAIYDVFLAYIDFVNRNKNKRKLKMGR